MTILHHRRGPRAVRRRFTTICEITDLNTFECEPCGVRGDEERIDRRDGVLLPRK